MLNRGYYPYKWLWYYAGDKFFEAEGEIKFSQVYRHIDILLSDALVNFAYFCVLKIE